MVEAATAAVADGDTRVRFVACRLLIRALLGRAIIGVGSTALPLGLRAVVCITTDAAVVLAVTSVLATLDRGALLV